MGYLKSRPMAQFKRILEVALVCNKKIYVSFGEMYPTLETFVGNVNDIKVFKQEVEKELGKPIFTDIITPDCILFEYTIDPETVGVNVQRTSKNSKYFWEGLEEILERVNAGLKNSEVPNTVLEVPAQLLKTGCERLHFSESQKDNCVDIARGIARLENSEYIQAVHIAEALQYSHLSSYFVDYLKEVYRLLKVELKALKLTPAKLEKL